MKNILAATAAALLASSFALPAAAQSENSASQDAPGIIKKNTPGVEATDRAPGQLQKDGTAESASDVAPGQMKPSKETTASISISSDQEVELRTILGGAGTTVDADFDIVVGATVPETVTLTPLPADAVEIVPVYANYEYFVTSDGQVVIVVPETHEIVYVLS